MGLGTWPVEYLRGHRDPRLWEVLAVLFNGFVVGDFPSSLNHMLLMPLYKKDDVVQPANYRPIALITPLSRLFSKVVTNRLLADPAAVRAEG